VTPSESAGAADRFAAIVQGPERDLHLDEAALLVAAQAYPGLDIDVWLGRLDDLASHCRDATFDGVITHVFGPLGFAGNHDEYYDPRNSFLNDVIVRRLGIPITLAVITMEIGRRLGVGIVGIGMPGHFLVRDGLDADAFVDPFAGGRRLGVEDCEAAFRARQGRDIRFDPRFLEPVGPVAIVSRLLANLKAIYRSGRERRSLEWVLRLRIALPGASLDERRELASVLAADGRFDEAGDELIVAAARYEESGEQDRAAELRSAATRVRARLN
jgi:regulator of sirC expression with transglutaminase-like and TPR domain